MLRQNLPLFISIFVLVSMLFFGTPGNGARSGIIKGARIAPAVIISEGINKIHFHKSIIAHSHVNNDRDERNP